MDFFNGLIDAATNVYGGVLEAEKAKYNARLAEANAAATAQQKRDTTRLVLLGGAALAAVVVILVLARR